MWYLCILYLVYLHVQLQVPSWILNLTLTLMRLSRMDADATQRAVRSDMCRQIF